MTCTFFASRFAARPQATFKFSTPKQTLAEIAIVNVRGGLMAATDAKVQKHVFAQVSPTSHGAAIPPCCPAT